MRSCIPVYNNFIWPFVYFMIGTRLCGRHVRTIYELCFAFPASFLSRLCIKPFIGNIGNRNLELRHFMIRLTYTSFIILVVYIKKLHTFVLKVCI